MKICGFFALFVSTSNLFQKRTDSLSKIHYREKWYSSFHVALFSKERLTPHIVQFFIRAVDGEFIWKPDKRGLQKNGNNVPLLRYEKQTCYVSTDSAVFISFCCPNGDNSLSTTHSWHRGLTGCKLRSRRVSHECFQDLRTCFTR